MLITPETVLDLRIAAQVVIIRKLLIDAYIQRIIELQAVIVHVTIVDEVKRQLRVDREILAAVIFGFRPEFIDQMQTVLKANSALQLVVSEMLLLLLRKVVNEIVQLGGAVGLNEGVHDTIRRRVIVR